MKPTFGKKLAKRVHAQRRLEERYGVSLSGKAYKEVVRCITYSTRTNPTANLIERQSQRVSVWEVPYNGNMLKAVYDQYRKEIVTFLPWTEQCQELIAA